MPQEATPSLFSSDPINKMWKHCAACHSGQSQFPPGFLYGSEKEVIVYLKNLKEKIIHRLEAGDNNGMPPTRPLREKLINSGDKEVILNFIRGL